MIFFRLVRVACQTISVFYFPTTEVATCSPRLPIFNNAACSRFNNAACVSKAECRFSTCKITPDNFPATEKAHTRFSHTVSLDHFSLGIWRYNADRKQSVLDDNQ